MVFIYFFAGGNFVSINPFVLILCLFGVILFLASLAFLDQLPTRMNMIFFFITRALIDLILSHALYNHRLKRTRGLTHIKVWYNFTSLLLDFLRTKYLFLFFVFLLILYNRATKREPYVVGMDRWLSWSVFSYLLFLVNLFLNGVVRYNRDERDLIHFKLFAPSQIWLAIFKIPYINTTFRLWCVKLSSKAVHQALLELAFLDFDNGAVFGAEIHTLTN